MRVLFTTFAVKSHMHAQVPLAWALQTAGHEVVIASQPDLADEITRTGLTAVSVGERLALDEWFAENENGQPDGWDPDKWDPRNAELMDMSEIRPEKLTWDHVSGVFRVMTNYVFNFNCSEQMMDDLVVFAKEWKPDLVIWDTMTWAGPIAAKAVGAAHARLLFALDLIGNMRGKFLELQAEDPENRQDDTIRTWLQGHLDRHGLEFDESMVTGQFTIDPVPPSMHFPVDLHYVPVRYVAYNGQAKVPQWLHEAPTRRRICLTLGVAKRETTGQEFTSIGDLLTALGDLDVEVIATLNEAQLKELPSIPDNVRVVDYVPLKALLPTCSAIIHHGGSGTFQTAMAYGVPQIIIPDMVWDTIHKATALEAAGAGVYIRDIEKLSGGELFEAVQRVLDDPSFAKAAAQIRREITGTPSPNTVVSQLENLATAYRYQEAAP